MIQVSGDGYACCFGTSSRTNDAVWATGCDLVSHQMPSGAQQWHGPGPICSSFSQGLGFVWYMILMISLDPAHCPLHPLRSDILNSSETWSARVARFMMIYVHGQRLHYHANPDPRRGYSTARATSHALFGAHTITTSLARQILRLKLTKANVRSMAPTNCRTCHFQTEHCWLTS